jgi:hypothetical protein
MIQINRASAVFVAFMTHEVTSYRYPVPFDHDTAEPDMIGQKYRFVSVIPGGAVHRAILLANHIRSSSPTQVL